MQYPQQLQGGFPFNKSYEIKLKAIIIQQTIHNICYIN